MSHDIESPKTFTLRAPLETSKGDVAELVLREPTAGDIEKLQQDAAKDGDAGALIKLIARQAKLAPADIRNIGARDFQALQDYIGSFFPPPPETSRS